MTTAETVTVIKDLVTCFATIGSAIWIVVRYLRHQSEVQQERLAESKRENEARAFEARKPFNAQQLSAYSQAAGVTGRLATLDPGSSEWNENVRRFYQLYWTELSMVEDQSVKEAMRCFSAHLKATISEHGSSANDGNKLQQPAYRLASALRDSLASSWDVRLASSEKPVT